MTKNQNMRIDLWRWSLANLKAIGNYLERYPLYTIVPHQTVKRLMTECDYDLEAFARDYVRIEGGNKVCVKGLLILKPEERRR